MIFDDCAKEKQFIHHNLKNKPLTTKDTKVHKGNLNNRNFVGLSFVYLRVLRG